MGRLLYKEKTTAVFGDVGGHWKPLMNGLDALGVDHKNKIIPKNLVIVQAGDLIHKGRSTNELVAFVDAMIMKNNDDPERGSWVQLFGNHESQYIAGAPRFWKMECSAQSIAILNKWWQSSDSRLFHIVEQENGKPFVITHAGIGRDFYYRAESYQRQRQGENIDVDAAVEKQNPENFFKWLASLQPSDISIPARPGIMLLGKRNIQAGPLWAESISEVYGQWRNYPTPFHQIHGHVTPYNWSNSKFDSRVDEVFTESIIYHARKRHSMWQNADGTLFFGVDPGFNRSADRDTITPLMLTAQGWS